jgi:hypothetical protein
MVRNQKKMTKESGFKPGKMLAPAVVMLAFWAQAFLMWQASGEFMALFFFGYICASVGIGLGLHAALPEKEALLHQERTARALYGVQPVPDVHHRLRAGGTAAIFWPGSRRPCVTAAPCRKTANSRRSLIVA